MAADHAEAWDRNPRSPLAVPGIPARLGRRLSAWSLGDLASLALLVLLALAPLERGLFFAAGRLPFEAFVAMLAAVAAVDRGLHRERPLWNRAMDWAFLVYTLGFVLSALVHPAAPAAARDGAFLGLALLLWYWSAAHLLRGAYRLRLVANVTFASGVVLSLFGALDAVGVLNFPYAVLYDRVLSTLQYPNALAAWIIVSLYAGFGLMLDLLSRPAQRLGQWWLALYGAGIAVMAVILVGTYSRGGWLVFLAAGAFWLYGLPPVARRDALVSAVWPVLVGLLFSRAFLSVFHQTTPLSAAATIRGVFVLSGSAAVGAIGSPAYRLIRRALRRQRWTPAVRRAVTVSAVAYGVVMVLILGAVVRHDALRGGEGVLGQTFSSRLGSVGAGGGSVETRFMLWADAWRMIRARPLLGYGGGGWAALYHEFQSMGYSISLVHSSVLQAWVDGGLLAVAGLVAVGVLLFRAGWLRRRHRSDGFILWGLAVGGCALWVHSLIDFDLSIPAMAILLGTLAGCLRESAKGTEAPPAPRLLAAGGLAVTGVSAAVLLLYAQHFGLAQRLGAFSAAAIEDRQYAEAYATGAQAARLDPLSAPYQADLAQLLAAAYGVNHVASERARAVAAGHAAMRLDPGDLPSQVAVLDVALELQAWPHLRTWATLVLARFPVDATAYERVGTALTDAAQAEIPQGDVQGTRSDLTLVAGLQQRYGAAAARLGQGSPFPQAPLSTDVALDQGEAELLLGQDQAALTDLGPLAQQGNGQAAGWLAAAQMRLGDPVAAQGTLRAPATKAAASAAFQVAQHLLTLGLGADS